MAKTELTKQLEYILQRRLGRAECGCKEVTIGWYGREVVDFITCSIDKKREIKCFEIKISKSDFHSKSKVTFIGHKNYYVMPTELFEQVKGQIPKGIGVYGNDTQSILNGRDLHCLKRATQQKLKESKEVILSSMLRSMQREWFKEIKNKQ